MGPSLGWRQSWKCSRYWTVDGSRTERAHSVRKAEGYRRLAAAMEEMVRERVWWSTVSCTGVVLAKETGGWDGGARGAAVGDGYTLGGGTTLGGCTTLGGGITLSGGDAVGVSYEGASALVVFQLVKRSRSLNIYDNCSWWVVVEASLTEQDKKFRAWTILSLGVTSGWVRYAWITSMVSEMMIDLVVAFTT